jgi:hypothetical protein
VQDLGDTIAMARMMMADDAATARRKKTTHLLLDDLPGVNENTADCLVFLNILY